MDPIAAWDSSNRGIEPSPAFEARVMRAVEAQRTPPLRFPLARLLLGAGSGAAAVGGLALLPAAGAAGVALLALPAALLLALVASLPLWIESGA
jgi:hypothetical protein